MILGLVSFIGVKTCEYFKEQERLEEQRRLHELEQTDYKYVLKNLLVGSLECGKSSILNSISGLPFPGVYTRTIGVDFVILKVGKVKFQIWEGAGDPRFRSIVHSYFKGQHVYTICYDVTSKKSFEEVDYWYKEMIQIASDQPFWLLGLKTDLESKRVIPTVDGEKYARDRNMFFLEFSSKEDSIKVFNSKMEEISSKLIHTNF